MGDLSRRCHFNDAGAGESRSELGGLRRRHTGAAAILVLVRRRSRCPVVSGARILAWT